jgi:ligand-binding sensor domain-containing protein/two-component sensor histidine kinase
LILKCFQNRVALLLVSIFCFSTLTFSQSSQLQNFNTKEGLPQSQVYDMVQDSIGYLWLATQGGGLARFDGDEFTVFNEKAGLKSNFVNSLFVSNDSLFVGTFSGLSIYTKGKFTNFESPKVHNITKINQQLYLTTDKGIFRYQKDSLVPVQTVTVIDLNIVSDIIKEKDNYLIATKKGLWVLDELENPSSAKKLDVADYTSFHRDGDRIFAATYDNGFKIIQNGKIVGIQQQAKSINKIHQLNQDFWLATESEGIVVLDRRFRKKQQINQQNGLAINQIRSILKDQQENIWIATSGGGLYKLTQNNFQHFDRNSGLRGNRIYAVHKKKDEIWISSSEKGVSKIDSLGITPIFADKGFLNIKAKTIASDAYDNIWVGTEGKGILIFKRKPIPLDSIQQNSKFDSLNKNLFPDYVLETDTLTIEDNLTSNFIKKILVQDRSVWVATYSSGIIELIYGKGGSTIKVWDYYGTKKGIRDLHITDLEEDENDKIWYTTKSGNLGYIDKGQARSFYRILDKEITITTLEIQENDIYLGTLGDGVWIVNKESPREVKQLSGVKELNSQNIYQLIFDNENNLWVGTEKGVNKVVLDANNSIQDVFYFDRSDGFLGIETCQNAIDKDDQGNIWFGTMNGLTKYIPTNNQAKKIQPNIYFEKIEVGFQAIDSIDINNFEDVLSLQPKENDVSFQFKSVDINHPKDVQYRRKLTRGGSNGEFSPWSSEESINFANLRAGTYEFTVQARNMDWVESEPISFQFFIDKPWYQKSWFLAIVYLGSALIIVVIVVISSRRIKQKNKRKVAQLELENHLLSLEQKALQLQMNPHFIFNVLNGIKAMGYEGDTEQMNSTINTFATLLRSILNSSREEEISLQQEVQTLENYLILEQQMAAQAFDYEIKTETAGIDLEEILIPPMLIQPFVENSVKHGFQHNAIKGKVTVRFEVQGEFLECEVRDNGIGIEQSKLKKKHHHPSTALKVTQERIASLSNNHQLKIREEQGTIVSFRLPLKTDF